MKGSYQIASTFDIYININESLDVNQDGPSLIIEAPSPPPPPLPPPCTYISTVTRSAFADILVDPKDSEKKIIFPILT